jgi:hypothetical protein
VKAFAEYQISDLSYADLIDSIFCNYREGFVFNVFSLFVSSYINAEVESLTEIFQKELAEANNLTASEVEHDFSSSEMCRKRKWQKGVEAMQL